MVNKEVKCDHVVSYSEGVDESWLNYKSSSVDYCYVEIVFNYCPICGENVMGMWWNESTSEK